MSRGYSDKTLIEFKLASNSQLRRNLPKQVEIYENANATRASIKVIIIYTQQEEAKVTKILSNLKIAGDESVVHPCGCRQEAFCVEGSAIRTTSCCGS